MTRAKPKRPPPNLLPTGRDVEAFSTYFDGDAYELESDDAEVRRRAAERLLGREAVRL